MRRRTRNRSGSSDKFARYAFLNASGEIYYREVGKKAPDDEYSFAARRAKTLDPSVRTLVVSVKAKKSISQKLAISEAAARECSLLFEGN